MDWYLDFLLISLFLRASFMIFPFFKSFGISSSMNILWISLRWVWVNSVSGCSGQLENNILLILIAYQLIKIESLLYPYSILLLGWISRKLLLKDHFSWATRIKFSANRIGSLSYIFVFGCQSYAHHIFKASCFSLNMIFQFLFSLYRSKRNWVIE